MGLALERLPDDGAIKVDCWQSRDWQHVSGR